MVINASRGICQKDETVYRLEEKSYRGRIIGRQGIMKCRKPRLSSRSGSSGNRSGLGGRCHTVDLTCLWAVLRDVADFATPIARLGAFVVDGAAVRSSAVTGDMAKLAASVALHGLGLAVASEVVGPAALVARSSTIAAIVPSAHAATASSVSSARGAAVGAVALQLISQGSGRNFPHSTYSKVSNLAAGIAARVAATAQAQRWAVSLHVAETLTVIALLG